jgi:hypothetical protein
MIGRLLRLKFKNAPVAFDMTQHAAALDGYVPLAFAPGEVYQFD